MCLYMKEKILVKVNRYRPIERESKRDNTKVREKKREKRKSVFFVSMVRLT